MRDDRRTWVTVPDVARSVGVEPEPAMMWAAGRTVADLWVAINGTQPEVIERPKTTGNGSHHFAGYPPEWAQRIADVLRSMEAASARQGALFE